MRKRKKAAPKPPTTAVMALAKLIAIKRRAGSHRETAEAVIHEEMGGNRSSRVRDAQGQQHKLLQASREILLYHVQDLLARQVEKHGADAKRASPRRRWPRAIAARFSDSQRCRGTEP